MPKKIFDPDARMSLFDHLTELRARLMKVVLAIGVLAVLALIFARPIFAILMKPVLDALPPEGRALVYTSGVEEINVLMKVGLYGGVFLSTPVMLWQLWGFVAPGLYPSERRFAGPFVALGSVAFIIGLLFCYFGLLPTMFQFLLQEGDSAALATRVQTAKVREQEALRYLRIGEPERADELAKQADTELHASGDGAVGNADVTPVSVLDLQGRLEGLGRLVDAAGDGVGLAGRPVLREVMDRRLEAIDAFAKQDLKLASQKLDEAAGLLAGVAPLHSAPIADLWKLEKDAAFGNGTYQSQTWTRPMLTMSEQLELVLVLELAFGVIFELPLVMALLGVVGLLKTSFLMKYQRHAFVVVLILAAVITPTGDAINLALMAGPMLACFEAGVLGVWLVERRRKREAAETAIAPAP